MAFEAVVHNFDFDTMEYKFGKQTVKENLSIQEITTILNSPTSDKMGNRFPIRIITERFFVERIHTSREEAGPNILTGALNAQYIFSYNSTIPIPRALESTQQVLQEISNVTALSHHDWEISKRQGITRRTFYIILVVANILPVFNILVAIDLLGVVMGNPTLVSTLVILIGVSVVLITNIIHSFRHMLSFGVLIDIAVSVPYIIEISTEGLMGIEQKTPQNSWLLTVLQYSQVIYCIIFIYINIIMAYTPNIIFFVFIGFEILMMVLSLPFALWFIIIPQIRKEREDKEIIMQHLLNEVHNSSSESANYYLNVYNLVKSKPVPSATLSTYISTLIPVVSAALPIINGVLSYLTTII